MKGHRTSLRAKRSNLPVGGPRLLRRCAPRNDRRETACHHASARYARAFTLVEVVISTIVVAIMLVAGLSTVGASRMAQHKAALMIRGRLLAGQLMSEILEQSYSDPDGTATFGREPGESTASICTSRPRPCW
jgi:type II secretory pathway pseudopilin PulG